MEQDLRNEFKDLKLYTLECISSLKKDDYDALDQLLMKRQGSLNLINQMDYSNEELRNLVEEFNILSNQKILSELIDEKKVELRDRIDNVEKNKSATNSYNSTFSRSAVIFSKKI